MRRTTKAERAKLGKELREYGAKEMQHLAKYAGREYASLGFDIASELGSFFTGVKASTPGKSR